MASKMKKFKVVDDSYLAVPNNGYILNYKDDHVRYNTTLYPEGFLSMELGEVLKSFESHEYSVLCKDENDEMYSVIFMTMEGFEDEPVMWQKVKLAENNP